MLSFIIDTLFGCTHRNYTFPLKDKKMDYVVCLDCGSEFEYDWAKMQRGKKISPRITKGPVEAQAS